MELLQKLNESSLIFSPSSSILIIDCEQPKCEHMLSALSPTQSGGDTDNQTSNTIHTSLAFSAIVMTRWPHYTTVPAENGGRRKNGKISAGWISLFRVDSVCLLWEDPVPFHQQSSHYSIMSRRRRSSQTIGARLGPLACVQWSHSLGRLHHRGIFSEAMGESILTMP